jgi:hypothetical protein
MVRKKSPLVFAILICLFRTPLPRFQLDLDLPAADRWTAIGSLYRDQAPNLIAYLETVIPKWAIPIVEAIGSVTLLFRTFLTYFLSAAKISSLSFASTGMK